MAHAKSGGFEWGDAPKTNWIDISIPFRNKMVHWPTDPVPRVERINDRDKGDPVTLTEMQFIDHVGTHVDAPSISSRAAGRSTRCQLMPRWDEPRHRDQGR